MKTSADIMCIVSSNHMYQLQLRSENSNSNFLHMLATRLILSSLEFAQGAEKWNIWQTIGYLEWWRNRRKYDTLTPEEDNQTITVEIITSNFLWTTFTKFQHLLVKNKRKEDPIPNCRIQITKSQQNSVFLCVSNTIWY